MKHESCTGCKHDLGRGRDNCLLNVAYECRDGGGFEAWEAPDEVPLADDQPMDEVNEIFTCPYCGAEVEYVSAFDKVIIRPPLNNGFLPTGRFNQIAWLISYSLCLLMLGAILYKFVIGPLV